MTRDLPAAEFDVVVPTRNRPHKLARCLDALLASDVDAAFEIWVCDSSDESLAGEVAGVCERDPRVHLYHHRRIGYAQARNACGEVGTAPVVISVDDDVYVRPDALARLMAAYRRSGAWSVVAGSVAWGDDWTRPIVMRRIGYGRYAQPGERPDFVLTAMYLYPRELLLACPFNERIRSSDDRFVGALWKARGVEVVYEPEARAAHDDELTTALGAAEHQDSHIYANLFQAIWVERSAMLAAQYEVLGFAAGLKAWGRSREQLPIFLRAWGLGHRALLRDRRWLSAITRAPLVADPTR